jgi:hypothetical protein
MGFAAVFGAAIVIALQLDMIGFDVWERQNPLGSPVAVVSVHDGVVTLADGRVFRPASVVRRESVEPALYDDAIRAVCAQGVELQRELGDGQAFLLAEPKFYNWCGTRTGLTRWAGSCFQCPVSELLVHLGYAELDATQSDLSARERWRLEGAAGGLRREDQPIRLSREMKAFRYDPSFNVYRDLDVELEYWWKPPPTEP